MTITRRSADLSGGRLLSARRTLVSLAAGFAAGVVAGLLATPRLLPLVTWTVTVAVLLTWVWWMSWPQNWEGTKRLAEQESTSRSSDVWLLAAAVASLAVVAVALVQSSSQRDATAVASVLLSVLSVALSWALGRVGEWFEWAAPSRLRYG